MFCIAKLIDVFPTYILKLCRELSRLLPFALGIKRNLADNRQNACSCIYRASFSSSRLAVSSTACASTWPAA